MNTDQFTTIEESERSEDSDVALSPTDDSAFAERPAPRSGRPFDPISAVFGLLACFAGAVVATGLVDPIGADDAGTWIAAAVIALGVVLLPWGARRT